MVKNKVLIKDFSNQKIPSEKQPKSNGSSEKGVVGDLLANDLVQRLALMVIEIERSNNTTCS